MIGNLGPKISNGSRDPYHAHLGLFVIPRLRLRLHVSYLITKFDYFQIPPAKYGNNSN